MRIAGSALSAMALALLAACGPEAEPAPDSTATPDETPSPTPKVTPFDGSLPGPDETDPMVLVTYWVGAVEANEREAARRAWRKDVRMGGMAPRWATLSGVSVKTGEGREEGAAGSLYYTIPVELSGTDTAGAPKILKGKMTLRRVNDVPGADAEQLSWRIYQIDWEG